MNPILLGVHLSPGHRGQDGVESGSAFFSRLSYIITPLASPALWVVRSAGDQMMLWETGRICVPVSTCWGGSDRYLCLLTPGLSMLIYRLYLSLLINDVLLP